MKIAGKVSGQATGAWSRQAAEPGQGPPAGCLGPAPSVAEFSAKLLLESSWCILIQDIGPRISGNVSNLPICRYLGWRSVTDEDECLIYKYLSSLYLWTWIWKTFFEWICIITFFIDLRKLNENWTVFECFIHVCRYYPIPLLMSNIQWTFNPTLHGWDTFPLSVLVSLSLLLKCHNTPVHSVHCNFSAHKS